MYLQEINDQNYRMMAGTNRKENGRLFGPGNRKRLYFIIKLIVGFSIIGYILYFIGIRSTWERIAAINVFSFTIAFGLIVLQYAVFSIRWCYLARCTGGNLPIAHAIIGNFELAFFTQILPSALAGDAIRIIRAQRVGLTLSQSVTSVLLDRLVGLTTVVFLTPFLFLTAAYDQLDSSVFVTITILPLLFVGGLFMLYFLRDAIVWVGNFRVIRLFVLISESFRALVGNLRISCLAVLASVLGYGLGAVALASIADALSLPVGLSIALPVVCMMTLATFVPVSIGGWGVREGAAVFGFGLFLIKPEDALLISILYGIIGTLVGIVGGIVWLFAQDGRRTKMP